jgi:hypothetical protein
MDYKFSIISNSGDIKEKYLEKNHERIILLLNDCFDIQYKNYENIKYIKNKDFFICTIDDKLIGIATGSEQNGITKTNIITRVYDTTYLYSDGDIVDYVDQKNITYENVSLNPSIGSICKDMNYENVGRQMLQYIENYYRSKGFDKIYLVPESNKYRNELLNAHIENDGENDSNLNIIRKKYLDTQKNLINYYKKNGYEIYEKYYEVEGLPLSSTQMDPNIIFFNVLFKTL